MANTILYVGEISLFRDGLPVWADGLHVVS